MDYLLPQIPLNKKFGLGSQIQFSGAQCYEFGRQVLRLEIQLEDLTLIMLGPLNSVHLIWFNRLRENNEEYVSEEDEGD